MNAHAFDAALRINERGSALGSLAVDNCFALIGDAISEAFEVELNHPLMGGKSGLVLGERRYIMNDEFGRRGAQIEMRGGKAVIRRAKVETYGDWNIPLLRKFEGEREVKFKLVHVNFGMPKGMQLRTGLEELWAGIRGGKLIARGECEALVEVREGDILQVFSPHGAVGVVKYADIKEGVVKDFFLDINGALLARLELLADNFKSAGEFKDLYRRAISEDGALHGFAAMLLMAGDRSDLLRKILDKVEGLVNGTGLRSGVKTHLRSALAAVGHTNYYGWMFIRGHEEPVVATSTKPPEKSGPSRAEIDARRAENRARRHAAQTRPGGNGKKKQKGKK